MALYTGKGDDGTTTTFSCDQRRSKNSEVSEALGSLDEINSYLGIVKLKGNSFKFKEYTYYSIINQIQENLFCIQAEIAGYSKEFDIDKVKFLENLINEIEKELPPIKTFFISGGTELASKLDYARTLARRAERRVVGVKDGGTLVQSTTLAYLNRLSSLLYAMARLTNHLSGINEVSPSYS